MDAVVGTLKFENKAVIPTDPRTKLFLTVTVSTIMITGGTGGFMNLVRPCLMACPIVFLLLSRKWGAAARFAVTYAILFTLELTVFEWADRLKALRDRKEALEAELRQVNMDIDNADWHLSNLMAESETQNFTRAGTMFCLTTKTRANAAPGRKDELFDALRAEGYGDMITETVNANSLSSFVKEQIAENGDELPGWLRGLVNVFEKTTVGVRKAR